MPDHLVRPIRTVLAAVLLVFVAGACDSSPEIPTEPEGDIPFNAVAINAETLQPAPGTVLDAGSAGLSYNAEVAFQITDEEFAQAGNPLFLFWLETWSGDGSAWEGDMVREVVFEDVQAGVHTFQGTFSVPNTSPFCSAYSEMAVAVWLLTATDPPSDDPNLDPDDDKTAASSTLDRVFADVNGADGTTANCMQHIASHNDFTFYWGDDIIFWARNIDPAANVQFLVGPDNMPGEIIAEGHFENGESGYAVWLPAAADGQVTMTVDGVEVAVYGANIRTNLDFDGAEDIFWPNDSFDDPAFDFIARRWFVPTVFAWNPSLSIHAPEQEVDAAANPLNTETWMKGDWYSLSLDGVEAGTAVDVCSWIFFDGADDLDLLIFDDQGNELDRSTQAGTTSEFVRVNSVAADSELRLWVAPFSLGTEFGVYEVLSADCALFGGAPEAIVTPPDPGEFMRPPATSQMQTASSALSAPALRDGERKARSGTATDDLDLH